ncbi:MAG: class A beta-lactamase-related serine hydrolase [Nevskiaceae bacterium]|nr:MAG: class A beta-lactamase-related serine hydrolase [Nevskiaceae bacterium]TAM25195.1 MAG: class A beta-lactamase-related serine hydrolase [Nevskiaceae bacterium]
MSKSRWVQVPKDLGPLSHIDHAAEFGEQDTGVSEADRERIWAAMQGLYRSGAHPAITLVMRRQGRIVLKRSIGRVSGNAPGEIGPEVPLHPDSPVCLFSASKAITAILVHKLAEQGRLRLDDRVADYIPEFAARGKGAVTIRQLLAHRAGIPTLPVKHPDPSLLQHWDALVHLLCLAPPFDPRFEKQAYHALTVGFIVGELIRRVSGVELRDYLREVLTGPLKLDSMSFGLTPERRALAPKSYGTGPKPFWPVTQYAQRIIGVSFERAAEAANEEGFLSSVVPSGNIFANADDACKVFQMLLNGGELDGVRVLQAETVAEAVRPVGKIQYDGMLMVPLRFSAGFMLGESPFGLFGPKSHEAFGHLGFVSVLCWADPRRDISVALLNTGKSMAPGALLQLARLLGAIGRAGR